MNKKFETLLVKYSYNIGVIWIKYTKIVKNVFKQLVGETDFEL